MPILHLTLTEARPHYAMPLPYLAVPSPTKTTRNRTLPNQSGTKRRSTLPSQYFTLPSIAAAQPCPAVPYRHFALARTTHYRTVTLLHIASAQQHCTPTLPHNTSAEHNFASPLPRLCFTLPLRDRALLRITLPEPCETRRNPALRNRNRTLLCLYRAEPHATPHCQTNTQRNPALPKPRRAMHRCCRTGPIKAQLRPT